MVAKALQLTTTIYESSHPYKRLTNFVKRNKGSIDKSIKLSLPMIAKETYNKCTHAINAAKKLISAWQGKIPLLLIQSLNQTPTPIRHQLFEKIRKELPKDFFAAMATLLGTG